MQDVEYRLDWWNRISPYILYFMMYSRLIGVIDIAIAIDGYR
jgi:hypothetical protein